MNSAADLHTIRLSIARRIVEHIRHDTSDLAPSAMRNPAAVYTDSEHHQRERQLLFRETPVVACLSQELPEPLSYRVFDDVGVPIVVTRGEDGKVRAFLNICTHRGARLVRRDEGKSKLFRCWFHGWSFDTQGRLRGAPERERFGDCLAASEHLTEVPAAERYGLVFVQATPGQTMDIDAHLGDFAAQLKLLNIERAAPVAADTMAVQANWKYALDTYGEGYHAVALHKETLGPLFRPDITVFDPFGPHFRIHFVEHSMAEWLDKPEDQWQVMDRIGGIHYIFPNTVIFVGKVKPGENFYQVFRHFPGESVGETITRHAIYAPSGVQSEEDRETVRQAFIDTRYVVEREDYIAAAEGWHNLLALPADHTLLFGQQELVLQHMHKNFSQRLGETTP